MAGSKKARIRSLERQLGSVGADPFIPARQPHLVHAAPPVSAPRGNAPKSGRRFGALVGVIVGIACIVGALALIRPLPWLTVLVIAVGVLLIVWGGLALLGIPHRPRRSLN